MPHASARPFTRPRGFQSGSTRSSECVRNGSAASRNFPSGCGEFRVQVEGRPSGDARLRERSTRNDTEVSHHPHVLVFEDMTVIEVHTWMVRKWDLDPNRLARQHQHRILPTYIDKRRLVSAIDTNGQQRQHRTIRQRRLWHPHAHLERARRAFHQLSGEPPYA
jgi:hypothetical protein